jgi:hypothetical protein
LAELNSLSVQKFQRALQTYGNAANVIRNMKEDLMFIHRAIKKINEGTELEISRHEYQNALVCLFLFSLFCQEKSKNIDIMSYGEKDISFGTNPNDQHKSEVLYLL